ncbi:MAG: ParB N-terminal domain-containing protein [Sphingomonas paucimobilis]
MATAVQKITLSSSRDIPFNKLLLSQSNIRRVKAGVSIEELAESIARRGLIQSISVFPQVDEAGQETGLFEVPAGGRRFRALELLVKQKRLAKLAPVPCIVRERGGAILAEEVSLAENVERAALHPLDQYRAFQDMRDRGMSEEEIASAFFVPVAVVRQRLRLVTVSPVLLDLYAEDGMTLEQLMAFSVCDDHERQLQVWEALKNSWSKEPYQIRHMLTESTVRANDKRAIFVGIDAYVAAGGHVLRDLFEADDGGWLQDPALLDRLVADKLKASAVDVGEEGWKWIAIGASFPYDATRGLRALAGETVPLPPAEQAAFDALSAEYQALEAEYDGHDELPEPVDQRLGEIETALEAFDARPLQYLPAEVARAGVFISIAHDGSLNIDRGYVRPEDEASAAPAGDADEQDGDAPDTPSVTRAVISIGGQPAPSEEDDEDNVIRPLPERLITELTAHRTLALRDSLARHPHIAMTALLHRLVSDTFRHRTQGGALEASVRGVYLPIQDETLKDSVSARAVHDRHAHWSAQLPAEDNDLWIWLAELDEAARLELLAHCVSFGVNALYERPNEHSGNGISRHGLATRLGQADRLARETGLDMAAVGWRPTVANYLGRVTKPRILEAVREGAGEQAAQLIDHLKKGDMAREAERLLSDSGWLPAPLRLLADPDGMTDDDDDANDGGEDVALPAFLADEDEDADLDPDGDAEALPHAAE